MLLVLANMGFLLNAFNLLPLGILDGGQTVHAAREAWRMPRIEFEGGVPVRAFAPDRERATAIYLFYFSLAALLVLGMLATRVNGSIL
jgi:membrane-associated protease RseP (regulator of RpoE activity)